MYLYQTPSEQEGVFRRGGNMDFLSNFSFSKFPLTFEDVAYAALLAFFFTWLILSVSKAFKLVISQPTEFEYNPSDLNKLLKKCYVLFPKEMVLFKGETYKRGMTVRITTTQKKIFEGRLIGGNNDNMICLLTNKNLVAQEIENIQEIVVL